jgi:flagellar hook-associated protein 1 FlgK
MINSLYTAQTGLDVSRYAVENASNNIANENTEGYTKRVANLSEIDTLDSVTGRGVLLDSITRITDTYLYNQIINQNSLSSYYEQKESILSNIETMFSETDTAGFSTTLSNFFSSLETLRASPDSLINQTDFEQNTKLVVSELKSLYSNLDDIQEDSMSLLTDQVDEVNSILDEISYLNKEILQNSNNSNNDLLDKRDALEKELSNYVDIEVESTSSSYNLKIAGVNAIFNTTNVHEVSINEEYIAQKDIYYSDELDDVNVVDGDIVTLTLNNTTTFSITANISGTDEFELKNQIVDEINNNPDFSSLEAYLDTSNNLIITSKETGEDAAFSLDISLNDAVIDKSDKSVKASNNVSIGIYGEDLPLTSGSIKSLTENLTTSTSTIASYKQSLDDFTNALVEITSQNSETVIFTGANVATLEYVKNSIDNLTSDDLENLAQIQWSDEYNIDSTSDDLTSFSEFYQNLLVTISSNVEDVNFKIEAQDAIINSLETTYDNLTKVDPDEEMINLMKYQAAYEANAKVITIVDEMLQTLLNL